MSEFDEGRYYRGLLNTARWYLRRWPTPGVEPEDVVHEAWWRARQASSWPDPWLYRRYLETYIKGVAYRWYTTYMSRNPLPLEDWAPSGQHVEAEVIARVELEQVMRALEGVHNGHLPLLRVMGWRTRDMAKELGVKEVTLQARTVAALRRAGLRG